MNTDRLSPSVVDCFIHTLLSGMLSSNNARGVMQEAAITINGATLTDTESMTVRVAIDTLANVLAEGLGLKDDGIELTDRYMASLSRIQALFEHRAPRKQ